MRPVGDGEGRVLQLQLRTDLRGEVREAWGLITTSVGERPLVVHRKLGTVETDEVI